MAERGVREEDTAVEAGGGDAGDGGASAVDEARDAGGVEGGVGGGPGDRAHRERRRSVRVGGGHRRIASVAVAPADDGPVRGGGGSLFFGLGRLDQRRFSAKNRLW